MTPSTGTPLSPRLERSNAFARKTLETYLAFDPETGSMIGMPGADVRGLDLAPDLEDRVHASFTAALATLRAARQGEGDGFVAQDLDIMIDALERALDRNAAERARLVPYGDRLAVIFEGLRGLLDERNPPARATVARPLRFRSSGQGRPQLLEEVLHDDQVPGTIGPHRGVDQEAASVGRHLEHPVLVVDLEPRARRRAEHDAARRRRWPARQVGRLDDLAGGLPEEQLPAVAAPHRVRPAVGPPRRGVEGCP